MKTVQELPGQKFHYVDAENGRLSDRAFCGRHNHRANGWQESMPFLNGTICRNCERVLAARQKGDVSV